MNTYNFDIDFTNGKIYGPNFLLVVNDHNSTTFKFTFDQKGRYVFKLLYPDNTIYVQDIIDGKIVLTKGVLNQEGNYKFEVCLYGDDNRLTTARIKEFPVRQELVETDEPVQADDRLPILDNLIEETNKVVEDAKNGNFDGATFTPSISEDGDLSWSNDQGKENPPTVNIKGAKGDPGAVKMQVVDNLPEVGKTDTIYLVKKEQPTEQNLYEEYVYTETSGWEHIGDTSVDLTDYYTKEETDEKLDGKQDTLTAGENITIDENTISAKEKCPTFYITIDKNTPYINGGTYNYLRDSQVVQEFREFLSTVDNMNFKIVVKFNSQFVNDGSYIECYPNIPLNQTPSEYASNHSTASFVSTVLYESTSVTNKGLGFKLYVQSSISNGEYTGISINTEPLPYLPTTTTNNSAVVNFVPTQDYHPATKQYVDNSLNTTVGENQLVFAKSFDYESYPNAGSLFYSSGCTDETTCAYFSEILTKMYQASPSSSLNTIGGTLLLTFPGGVKNGLTMCLYFYGGTMSFIGIGRSSSNMLNIKQYKLSFVYTSDETNKTIIVTKATIEESQVTSEVPTTDKSVANKKYVDEEHYKSITGYDGDKEQMLTHSKGVFTWKDITS